ncbi:hypothetical protein AGLY_005369 [Aphis glycines]|uniref:Uncharacterized protein n=1 Tax=Aphis glycines TaxID=307491 RepID=A0A6G0TUQ2_APHGL|nr:hypothetical protein AGLY_005369 [Aphis glycines]
MLCRAVVLVIVLQQIIADTRSGDVHGTALYKLTDVDRKTWTYAERIELQCRMTVGSLVPGANFSDYDGDIFLQYFDEVKNEAKKIISSVTRKRAMIAVVDALGGYLHAELLPRAKELYYEGQAKYSTVKRLHKLEKNIKYVLGTDGRGWARPTASGRNRSGAAPPVRRAGHQTSTVRPVVDDESAGQCGGVDAARYGLLRRWTKTAVDGDVDGYTNAAPSFDNDTRPHSLVVPCPERPVLYGMRDAGCHQTLFDHLATAGAAAPPPRRAALRQWLDGVVLPLAKTAPAADRWYPALWGVNLAARRLDEADGGGPRGGGRDHRQLDCDWTTEDGPGLEFYASIVLSSTAVCWTAALYIAIVGNSVGVHSDP